MCTVVYLVLLAAAVAYVTAANYSPDDTDYCQFPGVRYAKNPDDPYCSYRTCFPSSKKGQQFVIRCPPGTKVSGDFQWSSDSGYGASVPCGEKDVGLETCYFSANVPGKDSYIHNMKKMAKYVEEQKYAKAPTHEDYAEAKKYQQNSYVPKQVQKAPAPPKEDSYHVESDRMYPNYREEYKPREPEYTGRRRPAPRQRYH